MQREIFVQPELTGQGINPTLNEEGNIFMPDATNAEQNSGSPLAGLDTSGLNPRQILDALQVIQRLTPDQRRALGERLVREGGLPVDEAREAPHTGDRVRAQSGETETDTNAPPTEDPATMGLRGLDPSGFSDPKLQRVAEQAQELVENREVYSSQIERLLMKTKDLRLEGADKPEYERLVGSLRTAYERAKHEERIFTDQSDIEMISAHPLLKSHLEGVTQFFTKIKKEGRVDEAERTALVEAIRRTEMPLPRIDPEHPATFVSDAEDRLRSDFDLAKATLLGNIADAVGKIEGKRNEQFEKTVEVLEQAIRAGNYDAIESFIDRADPEIRESYSLVIEHAIEKIESKPDYNGDLDHIIEFTLEYALERILSAADKNPLEEYPQFSLYVTDNIDRIMHQARIYDESRARKFNRETDIYGYLVNLKSKRLVMHELFRGMKDPNTYLQLVTQRLRKSGFKFVEKDVVGVSDIQIIYEQVLAAALSEKSRQLPINQGWLTDQDFARADDLALKIFKDSARGRREYFKEVRHADGSVERRKLRDWEIGRAHMMGRSINAASQRRIVYAILGEIPENADLRYKSLESEYIARRLAPLKTLPDRFFGQKISRKQLDLIHEELKKDTITGEIDWTKYGYTREDGKHVGLYGQSQDAADIIDLLIVDPKSNSWRGRLMFLKQKDYQTERLADYPNQAFTIGEYLDLVKVKHTRHKHLNKKAFQDEIAPVIEKQRLFLGILMRFGDIGDKNKAVIWQNAARFLPSRIAAFFPEETLALAGGEANWIQIRNKLWTAERLRVKNDAEVLRTGEGELKELSAYFEAAGITDQREIQIIEALQSFGKDRNGNQIVKMPDAEAMAKIKQPFTAFLDDVPKTDWEELSDEDFNRILVSDQSDFAEGYGHLIGLIGGPIMKSDEFVKVFIETKDKIQGPPGLDDAQDKLEPFYNAALKMRRSTNKAKWIGAVMKAFRLGGRSEVEKLNLQAQIADDELDQMNILAALAQHEVIRDNPNEKDALGRTQYTRALERNKADRIHQLYRMLRLFTLLFGPIFAKTFLTTVFGNLKDLGLE